MSQPTGLLFDLRKFSIHDGPGIRTTVFFKGCPLRCAWCHNPESQSPYPDLILHAHRCIGCGACAAVCPQLSPPGPLSQGVRVDFCDVCGACVEACYAEARQMVGRIYPVDEVLAMIESDRAFYAQSGGGVTFSGGEPLMQPEFLGALLRACKAAGLHTALDTCGEAPWARLDALRSDVDLFLYDVKLVDDARHRQATGVSNRRILENLQRLSVLGHTIVLRLPLIPGLNDDEENLQATARLAAGLPALERIDLLAYHHTAENKYRSLGREYPLPGTPAMPAERLEAIRQRFARLGLPVADPPR